MDTSVQVTPGRARCRVAPTALALLESARHGLVSAADESSAGGRYVAAHLAALRAAAAIVAARPDRERAAAGRARRASGSSCRGWSPPWPNGRRSSRPGPASGRRRKPGLPRAVSVREADDLLRDAGTFLSLAEEALGVAAQAALPLRSTG